MHVPLIFPFSIQMTLFDVLLKLETLIFLFKTQTPIFSVYFFHSSLVVDFLFLVNLKFYKSY